MHPHTGVSGFGLSAAAACAVDATAFAFGPATSWGFFTIYVLASSGAIYALCPVAPFGEPACLCVRVSVCIPSCVCVCVYVRTCVCV